MTVSTPSSNLGAQCVWSGGLWPWPHHAGLATTTTAASYRRYIVCAPPLLRRSSGALRFTFRRDRRDGRNRPGCGLFSVLLPYGACHKIVAKPRIYNTWGNFFAAVFFSLVDRSGDPLCAFVHRAMVRENAESIGPHSFWALCHSLTLEQAIYLDATAQLFEVASPSQMFGR